MSESLKNNESLHNGVEKKLDAEDVVDLTKVKLDVTQTEIQEYIENNPSLEEISSQLISLLPGQNDLMFLKNFTQISEEEIYTLSSDTLGDWIDVTGVDLLILEENGSAITNNLFILLKTYLTILPNTQDRTASTLSGIVSQIKEKTKVDDLKKLEFTNLINTISSGIEMGEVDVTLAEQDPAKYRTAYSIALDSEDDVSHGKVGPAPIFSWTASSPIIQYLEKEYEKNGETEENSIANDMYQYIQRVRMGPILDSETALIGRGFLNLFDGQPLRASNVEGQPVVEQDLIDRINQTKLGSDLLEISIQSYVGQEAQAIYEPIQEMNTIIKMTEMTSSMEKGGAHDVAKQMEILDQSYNSLNLRSVMRHDLAVHALGENIVGVAEKQTQELTEKAIGIDDISTSSPLDVSLLQDTTTQFKTEYNSFAKRNLKRSNIMNKIPLILEAHYNRRSLSENDVFNGNDMHGDFNVRNSKANEMIWSMSREEFQNNKIVKLDQATLQRLELMLQMTKDKYLTDRKETLSPKITSIRAAIDEHKEMFEFIGKENLVLKSMLNGGTLPNVARQGLADLVMGVDDTERGKLARVYSLKMIEGLKKLFPQGPITLAIMKRLFPDFPDSIWEKANKDGTGGIISNEDPLQMLSFGGMIAGSPTYLDFSKYPAGEVVVKNGSGPERAKDAAKNGEALKFAKEVGSIGLSIFAMGKGSQVMFKSYKMKRMLVKLRKFQRINKSLKGLKKAGAITGSLATRTGKTLVKGGAFHFINRSIRSLMDMDQVISGEETFGGIIANNIGRTTTDQFGNKIQRDSKRVAIENAVSVVSGGILFSGVWARASKWNLGSIAGKKLDYSSLHSKLIETGGKRGAIKSVGAEAALFTAFHKRIIFPSQEAVLGAVESGDKNAFHEAIKGATDAFLEKPSVKEFVSNAVFIGALRSQSHLVGKAKEFKNEIVSKRVYQAKEIEFNKALTQKNIDITESGKKMLFFREGKPLDLAKIHPDLQVKFNELKSMQVEILATATLKKSAVYTVEENFNHTYGLINPRRTTSQQIEAKLTAAKKTKNAQEIKKREDIQTEYMSTIFPYIQVQRIGEVRTKQGWKESRKIKSPEQAIKNSNLPKPEWKKEMKRQFTEDFGIKPPKDKYLNEIWKMHQEGVLFGTVAQRNAQTQALKQLVKEGKITVEQRQLLADWGYVGTITNVKAGVSGAKELAVKSEKRLMLEKINLDKARQAEIIKDSKPAIKKEIRSIENRYKSKNAEIETIKEKLANTVLDMKELSKSIETYQVEISKSRSKKKDPVLLKLLEQKETDLKDLRNKRNDFQTKISDLKGELRKIDENLDKKKNEFDDLETELETIKINITEKTTEMNNLAKEKGGGAIKEIFKQALLPDVKTMMNGKDPVYLFKFKGVELRIDKGHRLYPAANAIKGIMKFWLHPQNIKDWKQWMIRLGFDNIMTTGLVSGIPLVGSLYDRYVAEPRYFILDLFRHMSGYRDILDEDTRNHNEFYDIYSLLNPERDRKPSIKFTYYIKGLFDGTVDVADKAVDAIDNLNKTGKILDDGTARRDSWFGDDAERESARKYLDKRREEKLKIREEYIDEDEGFMSGSGEGYMGGGFDRFFLDEIMPDNSTITSDDIEDGDVDIGDDEGVPTDGGDTGGTQPKPKKPSKKTPKKQTPKKKTDLQKEIDKRAEDLRKTQEKIRKRRKKGNKGESASDI